VKYLSAELENTRGEKSRPAYRAGLDPPLAGFSPFADFRAWRKPGDPVLLPPVNPLTESRPPPGSGGDPVADRLLTLVYEELRRLAAQKLTHETPGQTLQATALVHEAWLRLGGDRQPAWQNRAHFFAAAAEAMRRILIDNARRKQADRHGGGAERTALTPDCLEFATGLDDDQLLAVHEALEQLAAQDAVKAELVKLRFFAVLTMEAAAEVLGLSTPTAKRHWTYARAWLYRAIKRNQAG